LLPHLICCPPRFGAGWMMRRVSMATRDELVAAIVERYGRSNRSERGRILNEFVVVTGFHRKHAARLLGSGQRGGRVGPRPGRRVYDDAVREALIVLWKHPIGFAVSD
jgi:hypothetical protein